MTISNEDHIVFLHKARIILTITLLTLSVIIFAGFLFRDDFLSLSRYVWGSIPLLLYVFYLYLVHKMDINVIQMEVTREKIMFRFNAMTPFRRRKNALFEIPLKQFEKYTLQKSFFNQVSYLTFYQKIQGKLAKYPPVSLSGMKKKDREELYAALDLILSKKK